MGSLKRLGPFGHERALCSILQARVKTALKQCLQCRGEHPVAGNTCFRSVAVIDRVVDPRQLAAQSPVFLLRVAVGQETAFERVQQREQPKRHHGKTPNIGVGADAQLAAQQLRGTVIGRVDLQTAVAHGIGEVVAVNQPHLRVFVAAGDKHVVG